MLVFPVDDEDMAEMTGSTNSGVATELRQKDGEREGRDKAPPYQFGSGAPSMPNRATSRLKGRAGDQPVAHLTQE